MKKFLLTLALTGMCAFGLTACGNAGGANDNMLTDAEAPMLAAQLMDTLESYSEAYENGEIDPSALEEDDFLGAYLNSQDEIGDYISIVEGSVEVTESEDEFRIKFDINASKRNATVEYYYTGMDEGLTVSPKYELSELMEKAGMNTLLGMGTVFVVLILIMILIYLLGWISPVIEKAANAISASSAKRKEARAAKKAAKKAERDTDAAVDNTIAQIIKNEEVSDDTELVAVIAAAIAAYEGTSADGVVIRSIRRANTNKWQRA